jgi:ATP-dependent DNA helicase RecG
LSTIIAWFFSIDRASFQPVSFRTVDYVRVGSHKKKLRDHPDHARRLWKAFDQSAFEDGIALDDVGSDEITALLDYPAYFDLMEMPLPANLSAILDSLEADDLIKKSTEGRWHITNLGGILFAKRVDKFPSLRRRALRVISYDGTSRIGSSKERLGALGYANGFKGALDYIKGLLPANEVIHQALRKTVSMYPDLAVRELVANALIHQDFALSGTSPMVEIFDDRIEITNPGVPLMDPNRFVDMPPRSRNEKRFGIEMRNIAKASRMIKEAVEDGLIAVRDPAAPPKVRDYVPWWAASDRSTQS